jgi:hypothetical protein
MNDGTGSALSAYDKLSSAALAIVPGPDGAVTFLRQTSGPYGVMRSVKLSAVTLSQRRR